MLSLSATVSRVLQRSIWGLSGRGLISDIKF
jgi:hypothetical protein